ncbi:MAG: hypothetical protein K2X66_08980 [Cyanobacteria bacterium]|nr:hypothetical protein [Cyanobacteriota bacterium]
MLINSIPLNRSRWITSTKTTPIQFGNRTNYDFGELFKETLQSKGVYPFIFAGTLTPKDKPGICFYDSPTVSDTIRKSAEILAQLPNVNALPENPANLKQREIVVKHESQTIHWIIGLVDAHNLHGG